MTMDGLKAMKIWFLWNYTPGKNGKITKVPFSVYGGKTGTTEDYEDTWATYEEAVAAKEKSGVSGIGFKIPEEFYFLDIDHRDLNDSFVQELLNRHQTYAEKSPSGNGIHILGTCDAAKLPIVYDERKEHMKLAGEYYQKNPNNHIELYIGNATNRYATFTGNVINDLPLTDGTQAVLTTLDKDMRRKPKAKVEVPDEGENDDMDVICGLRKQKNAEKFIKLYDKGDISDYGSWSEADAALCAMIAFRTGDNPEAVDRVFRGSKLYRDKWERDDYRESTIALGIQACHGVFHKSVIEHPDFIKFDEKTFKPYISVPLLARHVREHMQYVLVRDNGKQALLKYVYENGCYRLYADNMMMGRIKQYISDYDEELVKMSKVNETLQHINTDLNYVSQDELNADEGIINFQNGLLNISAAATEMLPHSPEVLSTIQIPCEWEGTETPTPAFDSYLHTLTNGDEGVKQLLLEYIGVCISNVKGWRLKKALFLVGDGDTGKSQLKSLVERILGRGNFIGIDLKEIESRFGTGAVYGTRLAGSSDMSFMSVDELKTFKKMTGGDSLYAEFKGQQAFEFTYNGLLWFCMNRLPKFGGDDGKWVYDRIMVVKCQNVIPKDEQDKQLLDKMYAERDGIVYKAVKALQTVIANGYRFSEPESVTDARVQYQMENNTVISFFEDCMCEREGGKITDACTTGKIYKIYKAWCQDNNNGFAKTYKEFRTKLAEHLGAAFEDMIVKRNSGTFYKAYTLTAECKKEYSGVYGYDETEFLN
jgi:P4 family phage/plasmid primase-like protien